MNFRPKKSPFLLFTVAFTLLSVNLPLAAPTSYGQEVEVVIATTGQKSDVGFGNDFVGLMYGFSVSPDGSWWAGHFETQNSLDQFHMRGQGTLSTDVIWVEGQAAPGSLQGVIGDTTTERQINVGNSGEVAGLARNRDMGMTLGELVYHYDGLNLNVVAASNQSIPALQQANFGDRFFSPNVRSSSAVSFVADNITGTGISTANDAISLANDGQQLAGQQKGVTNYAGNPLQRIDENRFTLNTLGDEFIFSGDTTGDISSDDIVVVGGLGSAGNIVLQENVSQVVTSQGTELFDVASHVVFGGNDWFVAGDTVGGTGVVIQNGAVIASEGDLAPDGFRYSGDPLALAADENGNVAWAWQTDNPDLESNLLLVYNNQSILISEHELFQYDVDNNGIADTIRMDRMFDDVVDLELADGYAYFMTEIDNPTTTEFFGYAFLRVSTVPEPNSIAIIGLGILVLSGRRRSR